MSALASPLERENRKLRDRIDYLESALVALHLDVSGRDISWPRRWWLSPFETSVLSALYRAAPRICSRARLLRAHHPNGYEHLEDPNNVISVVVWRVRRKTPPEVEIEAIWCEGYCLTPAAAAFLSHWAVRS